MSELGDRIKELRTNRDLSMDMIVEDMKTKYPEIKINKSLFSRWENGQNEPSLTYVKYLAMYFNVSADYLAGLTDRKTPIRLLTR